MRVSTMYESDAYRWLLSLPRIGVSFRDLKQVMISMCPGALGAISGAPLVTVSIDIGRDKRVRAQGNSLSVAVKRAHAEWSRLAQHNTWPPPPDLPPEMFWVF